MTELSHERHETVTLPHHNHPMTNRNAVAAALAPRHRPLVITPARAKVARDLAALWAAGQPKTDYLASIETAVRYRLITDGQAEELRRMA